MNKQKKRVMVDLSATLIHHGHIRLLKKASKFGRVIIALTRDKEIKNPLARWKLATKSPFTFGNYELGDGYCLDILLNGALVNTVFIFL